MNEIEELRKQVADLQKENRDLKFSIGEKEFISQGLKIADHKLIKKVTDLQKENQFKTFLIGEKEFINQSLRIENQKLRKEVKNLLKFEPFSDEKIEMLKRDFRLQGKYMKNFAIPKCAYLERHEYIYRETK